LEDLVIGIDLGTTNSCVAVMLNGQVHVIPDEQGHRIQASVVSFLEDGSVVIGNEAKKELILDPVNTVYSTKRLMGWAFDSHQAQRMIAQLPYQVVKGENQNCMISIRGEDYALPEISALILHRMKDLAEVYLQRQVTKVVITVPANFNDNQRQMTKLAGELAGLEVLRMINEPTAAALAYGYGKAVDANLAIYDFGGGTFDMTVLKIKNNIFEVLSTAGDTYLGGDDFDHALSKVLQAYLISKYQIKQIEDPYLKGQLKQIAEVIKKKLSESEKIQISELIESMGNQYPLNLSIGRDIFKHYCSEIIQRTFLICDDAFSSLSFNASQVNDVILVGGSTRVPLVREMVESYFEKTPRSDIDPDEVVAIGAAIQGAMLNTQFSVQSTKNNPLLLDLIPASLGVQTVNGICEKLIPKNTSVPCEHKKIFTTTTDQQQLVKIPIFQGESRLASENIKLGEIELYGIRPAPRGTIEIEVIFEIDTDGLLSVTARDVETNLAQNIRIKVSSGYSEEEIQKMKQNLKQG
jgi:molecular chaperone DnaK